MKDPLVILHGTMKGISDMLNLVFRPTVASFLSLTPFLSQQADSLHKSDYKNWPPNLPVR